MAHETTLDAFVTEDRGSGVQTTLSWMPDGAPCADCGRTVRRRWRDVEGFVCSNCKRWARS